MYFHINISLLDYLIWEKVLVTQCPSTHSCQSLRIELSGQSYKFYLRYFDDDPQKDQQYFWNQ